MGVQDQLRAQGVKCRVSSEHGDCQSEGCASQVCHRHWGRSCFSPHQTTWDAYLPVEYHVSYTHTHTHTHTYIHRVIHIRWTCTQFFSHILALIHRATHIKFIYTPLTATHTLSQCRTLTHNHSYTHKLTDTHTGCVRQTDKPIMSRCALAGDPRLLWAGLCALDECRGCHPAGRLLDPSWPLCYLQSQINAPSSRSPHFLTPLILMPRSLPRGSFLCGQHVTLLEWSSFLKVCLGKFSFIPNSF